MYFLCQVHLEQLDGAPLQKKVIDLVYRYLNDGCASDDRTRFTYELAPGRNDQYRFWCSTESGLFVGESAKEFSPTCLAIVRRAYHAMTRAMRELGDVKVWVTIEQIPED